MKAAVYGISGIKKHEMEMPRVFESLIREDIAAKYFEASKEWQPYSPYFKAGKRHSASGTISHKRHDWKGQYGRGISRVPRKTMSRRGSQFNWVGAEVSGTRGGRRAHGPKGMRRERKINKKEAVIAINSGFAASASENYVLKRYGSLSKIPFGLPIVIESGLDKAKTKQVSELIEKIFGNLSSRLARKKEMRAGKGKMRGRKYKSNAGILLVMGKDENIKAKNVEVRKVRELTMKDLYPLGRLTIYTEKALKELEPGGKE